MYLKDVLCNCDVWMHFTNILYRKSKNPYLDCQRSVGKILVNIYIYIYIYMYIYIYTDICILTKSYTQICICVCRCPGTLAYIKLNMKDKMYIQMNLDNLKTFISPMPICCSARNSHSCPNLIHGNQLSPIQPPYG